MKPKLDPAAMIKEYKKQVKDLQAENNRLNEASQSLFCVVADVAGVVGISDSTPNLCRETVKAVKQLQAERDAAAALCAEQHKKIERLEKEQRG